MLTLWGAPHRFCDRLSRRNFLQVGALGLGGLTLPDLLRLRTEMGAQNVLGTVYHAQGIDYRQTLVDFTGRPRQLLDDGEPIHELVG